MSGLPAWLIIAFFGFCCSIPDPEERLYTAEEGRFEFALITSLGARSRSFPATPRPHRPPLAQPHTPTSACAACTH